MEERKFKRVDAAKMNEEEGLEKCYQDGVQGGNADTEKRRLERVDAAKMLK